MKLRNRIWSSECHRSSLLPLARALELDCADFTAPSIEARRLISSMAVFRGLSFFRRDTVVGAPFSLRSRWSTSVVVRSAFAIRSRWSTSVVVRAAFTIGSRWRSTIVVRSAFTVGSRWCSAVVVRSAFPCVSSACIILRRNQDSLFHQTDPIQRARFHDPVQRWKNQLVRGSPLQVHGHSPVVPGHTLPGAT